MINPAVESLPKSSIASTEETLIHVLHVDDEADYLKTAKKILEMQGAFQVETASSVEEAIKKVEDKTFDVIVSDYIMPGKDGLEFLKELRDSGNSIPFIIFTGKGREIVAIKALNLGADQYVNKIGKPEAVYSELAHSIRTVVKGKKAEEELRKSEEEKSAVLDSMSELVIHQDLKHRILWANKKAADTVNMKVEQVKRRYCHKLWAKSVNPCAGCPIEETIKTGQPQRGEIITPDGRVWSITGYPIRDANGNVTSVVEVTTEITAHKKAEEALRESEEKYRELLNGMNDTAWVIDFDSKFVDVNEAAVEVLGYSREELLSMGPQDIDSSLNPEEISGLVKGMPSDEIQLFETTHTTKDGKKIPVEISSSLVTYHGKRAILSIARDITDRKKAGEKLQESEEKFRNLAEKLPNMIFINKKGRVVYANKRCEEIIGYKREEFYSPDFNFFTLIAPESIDLLKSNYSRHLKGEEILPYEYTLITKEGKRLEAILTTKLITYEGESAILGIITGITERKQIEKQLKDSEEKYHKQFEKALDAIVLADAETGIIVDCNRAATKLVGRKKSELIGKHQQILHPPEDTKGEFSRSFKQHRKEKEGQVLEDQIITKNGEIRDVIINATTFEIEGKILVQGTFRDVTERKRVEAELRREKELMEMVTANNAAALAIISKDFRILWANRLLTEFLGDIRGKVCYSTLNNLTNVCPGCGVKEILEAGKSKVVHEQVVPGFRGQKVWLEITAIPIRNENGDIIAVSEMSIDITERKKAEEALDRMMNEVVTINEKLGVVGKLSRHDARNKLSVITNNVYLAKQKLAANHSALEYLGEIDSTIDQMEKIFDFARTYEMLGVEELSYMNVQTSVDEAAMLFPSLADVKLINECQGLKVMADSLLRQLFYNLIDNTLKHGEKVSQIRVYHEKVGEDQLKLVYEDDGIGIADGEKEKIFKEGYGKGTGYGLYLIEKICDEYGWTIRETGKSGKGAQFTMTIPKMNKSGQISYVIN